MIKRTQCHLIKIVGQVTMIQHYSVKKNSTLNVYIFWNLV